MHRKWRMTMHHLGDPCTRSASTRKYLKIQSNRSFVFATRISSFLRKNVAKTPLYMFFQTFTRLMRNQYAKEQGSMLHSLVTGQFFVISTRRSRITLFDSRNLKLPGGFFIRCMCSSGNDARTKRSFSERRCF